MALPVRVNPGQMIDPFEMMRSDFGNMLNRFFGPGVMEEGQLLAPYGVDVREDADHIYVDADLPGFSKNDIDISLDNNTLTISAEKKEERQEPQGQQKGQQGQQGKKGQYLLHERRYQRFSRSFTLPSTVDPQQVDAKLHEGILTVTLNKREESKPKKIPVA